MSSALISLPMPTATTISTTPIDIEPSASHIGLPVSMVDQDGDQGERKAEQRGEVLAEDHHQLALAALAEPAPQRCALPRTLFTSCRQARSETDLGGEAEHQDAHRHPGVGSAPPDAAACASPRRARTGRRARTAPARR